MTMALGSKAPDFSLPDTISGQTLHLYKEVQARGTLIMFICNHCPYVKHVQEGIVKLAKDYMPKGIHFFAISSNDVANYPEDSPQKMKEEALKMSYPFPYLYDETQNVAKAYSAACTPDFYVFDNMLKCVYRGQLDDSRPGNGIEVSGKDIRLALDNLLSGEEPLKIQKPSIGCNIKWKQA